MKNVLKYAAALALMFSGVGCDYNENFEGLQEGTTVTDIISLEMTLTDADYKAIATNSANKALAGDEEKDALAKLESNKYFTPTITAAKYVPNFLAKLYPTVDNTSSIKVTSNYDANIAPPELEALRNASTYQLTGANYQSVWEDDGTNKFLTDDKPLEDYADAILAEKYPDADPGNVKIVSYIHSEVAPGAGSTEEVVPTSLYETFDEGLGEWQSVKVTGTKDWGADNYKEVTSAWCSAYNSGAVESWLISPKVDLSTASTPKLAFDVRANFVKHQGLSVWVSTTHNGMDFKAEEWTELTDAFAYGLGLTQLNNSWYIAGVCDMSDYKSESVYVAFRYKGDQESGQTTNLYIDTIQLGDEIDIEEVGFVDAFAEDAPNWNIVTVTGTTPWFDKSYNNDWYMEVSAYKSTGAEESWLVNKNAITVPESGMTPTSLTFDLVVAHWKADGLTVLVSEDYTGDVATATWEDVTSNFTIPSEPASGFGKSLNAGSLSLKEKEGKAIYVAFKYVGDKTTGATTTYQVDNVKVSTLQHKAAAAAAQSVSTRAAARVVRYAAYTFNGEKWVATANTTVVNPEDYTAMGASEPTFSSSFSSYSYIPKYLHVAYPYALEGQTIDVAYHFTNSSGTSLSADRYTYDGSDWTRVTTVEVVTDQFVKRDNKWLWDPSVLIVLPSGKGQPLSTLYFQACVDWVRDNVKDGDKYITSYGNNDYYSGASAYQGNIDWRPEKAKEQYADGYAGMDDDQIVALMKERTIEVFDGVLTQMHSDAKPAEGIDVTYTIQFYVYTGVTLPYEIVYKVVAPGEFEYVEGSLKEI